MQCAKMSIPTHVFWWRIQQMSAPYPVLNKHVPWLVEFAVICFLYEILDKTKCVELSNQRGESLYKQNLLYTVWVAKRMQQTWLTPFNINQLYPKNELKLKVIELHFHLSILLHNPSWLYVLGVVFEELRHTQNNGNRCVHCNTC